MSPLPLSAAIVNGLDLVSETRHEVFVFDKPGDRTTDLLGADALGTAIVGLVGNASEAVEQVYTGPTGGPHGVLQLAWPWLFERWRARCPAFGCVTRDIHNRYAYTLINHLQDTHGWSRERIASWLRAQKL